MKSTGAGDAAHFASGGDAQPLKDFASKTAPVVEGHLEQVRGMQ